MLRFEGIGVVSPYPITTDGDGSPAASNADDAVGANERGERGEKNREEEEEGGHWIDSDGSNVVPDTAPGERQRRGEDCARFLGISTVSTRRT